MARDVEDIDALKEKLLAVSGEIDAIKNSFSKNAEDLSRIQSMLSVGKLEEISGIIEKFESRIAEAEKMRTEASDGAKKYSEELEKEKERLVKLWDAYKNQEEELSATERKLTEYDEKLRQAEASKQQLEDDLTSRINTLSQKTKENEEKIQKYDEYREKCDEFDGVINQLEREIHELKQENENKENTIRCLNEELEKLRGQENYADYKNKYEEVSAEYEKEKERLTKLYQLYEETDSECKRLQLKNNNWENWYNSNRDIFDKLFSTAPPTSNPECPPAPNEIDEPENPIKRDKKKKLSFRK